MLIICVHLSESSLYKNFIWDVECTMYLANGFLIGMFCFWGRLGFWRGNAAPFLPVPVRVLELESSGADPESSGAVDLETKRGISTPERK